MRLVLLGAGVVAIVAFAAFAVVDGAIAIINRAVGRRRF